MNEKEFAEIVKTTKGIVLSAIKNHLDAQYYHAIDDIIQETYIRAYNALIKKKYRGDSTLKTWLYSIAKNESLRMMKYQKREEEKLNNVLLDLRHKRKEKWLNDEIEKINANCIEKLIKELPEKYRCVIELIALGFSEEQIADQLAIKRGTVKSRASRGKELMHRIFRRGI